MELQDNKEEQPQDPEKNQEIRPRKASIELQKIETVSPNIYSAEKYDVEKSEKGRTASSLRPEIIPAPEGLSSWMTCLKYGLFVTNLIIWLFGVVIVAVSVWMKMDPDFWDLQFNLEMTQMSKAIYIGIAVGAIILLIGLTGCIGAFFENTCMLMLYIIVVFIIITLELAAVGVIWSATNKSEFGEKMKENIRRGIGSMTEDDDVRYFIDLLQSKLHCCGLKDEKDYENETRGTMHFPNSCVDQSTGFPYKTGCVDASIQYLKQKAGLFGGIFVAVLLIQLAALVPAICLCCGLRHGK